MKIEFLGFCKNNNDCNKLEQLIAFNSSNLMLLRFSAVVNNAYITINIIIITVIITTLLLLYINSTIIFAIYLRHIFAENVCEISFGSII